MAWIVKKNRGWIALAVVVVLAMVSGGVWKSGVFQSNPRHASKAELGRWLVLTDLQTQSPRVRLALVDRLLEVMLGDDPFSPNEQVDLSPALSSQLSANIELLQYDWFVSRVKRYAATPPDRRMPFLERQVEVVAAWTMLDSSDAEPAAAAAEFFDDLTRWVREASPAEAPAMNSAIGDATVCWLATRDLEELSMPVRRELGVRIAEQLDAAPGISPLAEQFTTEQQQRFTTNSRLLMEAWLHAQAGRFAKLAAAEKQPFVDRQLDRIFQWGVLEQLSNGSAAGPLLELVGLTSTWIERADEAIRPPLRELTNMAIQSLMKRPR